MSKEYSPSFSETPPFSERLAEATEEILFLQDEELASFGEWIKKREPVLARSVFSVLLSLRKSLPPSLLKQFRSRFSPDLSQLPLDPEKYRLESFLDQGGVARVFLLEAKSAESPSYVLKLVNQKIVAQFFHLSQKEVPAFIQREYETVRSWYTPDIREKVLLPEYFFLAKGPRGKNSLFILQPFQGTNIQDVFSGIERKTLFTLLCKHDDLRENFREFTLQTWRHAQEYEGEIPDLLGEKNLVLAWNDGYPSLRFLDAHPILSLRKNIHWRLVLKRRLMFLMNIIAEVDAHQKNTASLEEIERVRRKGIG